MSPPPRPTRPVPRPEGPVPMDVDVSTVPRLGGLAVPAPPPAERVGQAVPAIHVAKAVPVAPEEPLAVPGPQTLEDMLVMFMPVPGPAEVPQMVKLGGLAVPASPKLVIAAPAVAMRLQGSLFQRSLPRLSNLLLWVLRLDLPWRPLRRPLLKPHPRPPQLLHSFPLLLLERPNTRGRRPTTSPRLPDDEWSK